MVKGCRYREQSKELHSVFPVSRQTKKSLSVFLEAEVPASLFDCKAF